MLQSHILSAHAASRVCVLCVSVRPSSVHRVVRVWLCPVRWPASVCVSVRMVREVVSVHVGQCGLQLGSSFWHQVRGEHTRQQRREQRADHTAKAGKDSIGGGRGGRADSGAAGQSSEWWRWSASSAPLSASVDDSVSTFFHPLDSDAGPSSPFPYRARAVLVDMESGVLSALARSSQSSLFDSAVSVVSDVSGSGNNWAHGYCVFGPQYGRPVLECVRRQSEQCDSLQAFILTHSTGGGTGSGLGSYILEQLADEYSGVYRLDQCVLPSLERDDVVTSPYNAALSLPAIVRSADVVLPLDNQALVDICDGFHKSQQSPQQTATQLKHQLQQHSRPRTAASTASPSPPPPSVIGGGFSELNVLCASVLSCLTAGMRFPGELNVDLSDLVMNCCPFTDTNLLVPALSPLHATLQYHYTHDDGSTQSHQPLQQAGLEKATGRPALASRRRVDPSTGVQVANSLAAAPASSAAETSYYFHTVDTAQSLHSAQSTARHSVSAFGSSTRSPAVRGDMDAMQGGRTGGQHNDALFHTALQTSHQLLQVRHAALLCTVRVHIIGW